MDDEITRMTRAARQGAILKIQSVLEQEFTDDEPGEIGSVCKQALRELMRDSSPISSIGADPKSVSRQQGAARPPLCIRSVLLPNEPINQPREA